MTGSIKIFPFILTVPLLWAALAMSVFFNGTDSILYAPALACLSLCALIILWPRFRSGAWDLPWTATAGLALAFGAYVWLSVLWSSVSYISTIFALIIAVLPGLFLVLVTAPNLQQSMAAHTAGIIAGIGGFAAWILVQFFFFYDQYGPRIHHPMLNPNDMAAMLCLGLLPITGLFFAAEGKKKSAAFFALFLFFYMALLATQSRGGLLSFGFAALIMALFTVPRSRGGAIRFALFVVIALGLPFLVNYLGDGSLEKNLSSIAVVAKTKSAGDRLLLWGSTWEMIKDHLWTGIGLGTFYYHYPAYRSPSDRSDGYFAHSDPLQYGAEMGIIAPILFYGVLVAILWRTVRALRAPGATAAQRAAIIIPFCAMLAPTMNAHISFHLYMPGIMIPLAVILASWYVATDQALGAAAGRKALNLKGAARFAAPVLLLVLLLAANGWAVRWAASSYLLKQAIAVGKDEDKADEATQLFKKAQKIAPANYGKPYEAEARQMINGLWLNRNSMTPNGIRALYTQALGLLDKAEESNSAYTGIQDLRARLYYASDGFALRDGRAKAQTILEGVVKRNPLASDSRMGLAMIYSNMGDTAKARQLLEDGLKWPRTKGTPDVNYLMTLAQMREKAGDKEGAQFLSREALRRAKTYGMISEK